MNNVYHPEHYKDRCSIECIDAMILTFGEEATIDFCLCSAFKYIWRYKYKNGKEDLAKANWYVNYVLSEHEDGIYGDDSQKAELAYRLKDMLYYLETDEESEDETE